MKKYLPYTIKGIGNSTSNDITCGAITSNLTTLSLREKIYSMTITFAWKNRPLGYAIS